MKTPFRGFTAILYKEFLVVLRDPFTLFFMIFPPLVEMIAFGYALDTDVKNMRTIVLDQDRTEESRQLVRQFENTGTFKVIGEAQSVTELADLIRRGKAYVGVQIPPEFTRDLRAGRLSLPKVLFLLACGPLHAVVLLHPRWSTLMPPLLLAVIVTSFHNLQYEGIVWYHNQNRHRQPDAPTNPYWRFVPLYGIGLLIAIAMRHATWVLDGRYPALTGAGLVKGAAGYTAVELTAAFWWGVAMHHYYLDQKIWRVSKDSALQRTLRLPDKLAA